MTSGFTREFALSAVLMVTGAVLNGVATWTLLPPKAGGDHEAIFTRYADSGAWVAAHLVQFAGILVGLAGLFVLARALRHEGPHLAALAGAGAVAAAATCAVLQAVDGVALKQAVNAWVDAPRAEEATRFASAETVLWTGWGVQSFFYGVYSLTLVLLGVLVAVSHRFAAWDRGRGWPWRRVSSPWRLESTSPTGALRPSFTSGLASATSFSFWSSSWGSSSRKCGQMVGPKQTR